MKSKWMKNFGIIVLAIAICMLPQIKTFATVIHAGSIAMFNYEYVFGNEWTYVCSTSNTVWSDEVRIRVTDIYTASGAESLYSKVKVSPSFGSNMSSPTILKLDTSVYYTIPTLYCLPGNEYLLFAMGNTPILDCQISGTFSAE